EFRTALEEGRWPGDEVAQGALIIVGGTLLLTPGFLTDLLGFLFLLAPTRRLVSARLRRRVTTTTTGVPGAGATGTRTHPPRVTGTSAGAGRSGAFGPGSGTAAGRRPTRVRGADGEEVVLDVEVVEIRREVRPGSGGEPPGPATDPPGGEDAEG
ncbi:MAG: FxsA family protein, partial [Nitriliruptoraceae bacterium]